MQVDLYTDSTDNSERFGLWIGYAFTFTIISAIIFVLFSLLQGYFIFANFILTAGFLAGILMLYFGFKKRRL